MKKTIIGNKNAEKEIICTLGPASMKDGVIARLEELGVSLFRINLSHTGFKDVAGLIRFVQNATRVPICLDTEGAQIRTGSLKNGKVLLSDNSIVRVSREPILGDSSNFNLYPLGIITRLEVGDLVDIDFDSTLAQVIEKKRKFIRMRVLTGGFMGQNKAVSVDRDILMPPLTRKDLRALAVGKRMGIRHVALSFANQPSDVGEIRAFSAKDAFVISKIESIKGVANLEEIAAKSDALLLDRGDLSRQAPIESIPWIQKDVIRRAKKSGTKIYVATNLLESMVTAKTPTRAEVNDIFNTLNDGASGLVLAAETAIGSHPISCVTMVSKIIKQFENFPNGYSEKKLKKTNSFLLVEPHGGVLVNRVRNNFDKKEIKGYKTLTVDKTALLDAEQIAIGTFSPLEGFMTEREVKSVIARYRLPNGTVWPLPIVLQTTKRAARRLKIGDNVALVSEDRGVVHATLRLADIFTYDLKRIAKEMFGTDDSNHSGVQFLKKRGDVFLGGKIELLKRLPSKHKHFEITPRQARAIFESKNWVRVVGFHTRNVIHKVHEHIQMLAFQRYNCDGIFIHPVIGPKKKGDYVADIILKSYQRMMDKHYPAGKVVLGAFQSYSRYSGPREAVFTALCRKNFGCNYFIVGRDHTGLGNYYKSDDAHKLFHHLGDIGITPLFFNEMHYCKQCSGYVEKCRHSKEHILSISGTEARKIFKSKESPPGWFMREDISKFVLEEVKKGNKVFEH